MTEETVKGKTPPGPRPGPSCREWLIADRERLQRDHARCRGSEVRWSWIRLVVFAAAVCAVVLSRHDLLLAALATAIGAAAFFATLLRHTRWEDKRVRAEHVLVVVGESLHACTSRDRPVRTWQRPENPTEPSPSLPTIIESGPTWSLTDQERDDLDLYGPPVGLFGLLNRTSTDLGARRLRDVLDAPCLSHEHIRQRQQAIQWLDTHNEQRLGMMASIVPLRGRSAQLDTLVRLLHQTERHSRSIVSRGIRVWSVFSGLVVIHAMCRIVGGHIEWFRVFVGLLVVNSLILLVWKRLFRRLRDAVAPWADRRSTLRRLLAVAERAAEDLPTETPLSRLKDCFNEVVTHGEIPSVCAWLEWAGLHGMVRGLLNMLVFLDLHVAEAVLARVVPNRDVLLRGLAAMAELEALSSLACHSAEQPVTCYPQPADETILSIEDGRHPLIPEQEVTPNGVHLTPGQRMWVITGPNAAGKSTFLRMVGVNVLLAQAGAAVAAREMTWSPVRLMTDVRIRDDLAKHESYFLSEVRRLRRMVLDADGATAVLGLIDEPFRGTNSAERTAAGIALLEHLTASANLFLVATHEETLAQTAADVPSAENYHFQEHLTDGGITFDYRLRPGPATTRTALRILEQEGYPRDLLDRARRLMAP